MKRNSFLMQLDLLSRKKSVLRNVELHRTIAGSKIQRRRNTVQIKVFVSWIYANNPSLLLNVPYAVMQFAWQVQYCVIFVFHGFIFHTKICPGIKSVNSLVSNFVTLTKSWCYNVPQKH